MTDGEYLEAHLRGEAGAFAALVARHAGMVHGVAARRAPGQAEDVTQAVFLLLHRRARALRRRGNLAGWLYLTARLCARTAVRSEGRRRKYESEAGVIKAAKQAGTGAEEGAAAGLAPLLDDAVAALGSREREVVVLQYLQNKSVAEAAGVLGVSEGAAAKRSKRAVERMRRWFGKRGHVVPAGVVGAVLLAEGARPAPAAALAWQAGGVSAKAGALAKAAHGVMVAKKLAMVGAVTAAVVATAGVAVVKQGGRPAGGGALPVIAATTATRGAIPWTAVLKVHTVRDGGEAEEMRWSIDAPDKIRADYLKKDGSVDEARAPLIVNAGRSVRADERSHLYIIDDYPMDANLVTGLVGLATMRAGSEPRKLALPGGAREVVLEARPEERPGALQRLEVMQHAASGNRALEGSERIFVWLDEKGICKRLEIDDPKLTTAAEVEIDAVIPAGTFDLKAPAGYTDVREGIFPRLDPELRDIADHYYAAREALDHYRVAVLHGIYPRSRMVRDGERWRLDAPDLGAMMANKERFAVAEGQNPDATAYFDRVMSMDVKIESLVMTYQGQLAKLGYNYSTDDGGPAVRADWLVPPVLSTIGTEAENKKQMDERMKRLWFKQAPIDMVGPNLGQDDLRQLAWPAWKGDVLVAPHGWDLGTPPPVYYRLPDREGQPRLVGVRAIKGVEAADYWMDPRHDYLCMEYDTYFDPEMPWAKDPAEWDAVAEYAKARPVTPKGDPSHESQKIVEFGQTAGGKWYPKRMVRNGGADRYNQLFIMLDTPEKVDEALFKWPQGAPEPGTTPVNNNRVVLVGTAEAKEMEVRQKTEESLYLILNGCERYKQRQGRWPESLQVLVDGNYITAERLVNPRRPDAKPGWGYRVSRNAEMEPMVWEMFEKWPTEGAGKDFPAGIFVAHYGSVKVVVKEEEFKRLVEDP